jgi:3-oxoacyl-[acyl-carrier-protein] synthase II
MGVICATGRGTRAVWDALLEGRSGVGPVRNFDTSQHRVHCAAEIRELEGERTNSAIALVAFQEAWSAAGLPSGCGEGGNRIGLALGLLGGETLAFERGMVASPGDRTAGITKALARHYPPASTARQLASDYGIAGPVSTLANACSSGNHALAAASQWIREGRADTVVAGAVNQLALTCFTHFHNTRSLAPERCSPFDRNRRGLVLGEGAAFLALEAWESAQRRGAPILAELLGYGLSCDAHNMTAPHPEGRGAVAAMHDALEDSGLTPDAIDYVSAHGTGTPLNDRIETMAIHRVFGERGKRLPCSSTKSMIGHTMGASSAIEALVCCMAIREGRVPPTIHYQEPDPECEVDCVPNQSRTLDVRYAMNNSFAFGGNNCTVVFGPGE